MPVNHNKDDPEVRLRPKLRKVYDIRDQPEAEKSTYSRGSEATAAKNKARALPSKDSGTLEEMLEKRKAKGS